MDLFSNQIARGIELKEILKKKSAEYYGVNNDQDIDSDDDYDKLYDEYVELEAQFPELKDENSPTNIVGALVVSGLKKVTHLSPLLSIPFKEKAANELIKWYRSIGGNGVEILIQPKFDGLTVDLILFKFIMEYMATRGNGYIGEDISHNARVIKSIPKKIKFEGKLEVRGEGVLHVSDFFKRFSNEASNPRNFAAGTLRQLDSSICKERQPDVVFYDIGVCDKEFTKDSERLEFLKEQGFKTTPYLLVNNEDDLVKVCETRMNGMIPLINGFNVLTTENDVTDIMCDGIVLKVNDLALRDRVGFVQKGPKFMFAWKFKSLKAKTILREVIVNTTRTGKQAPVAVCDPINLGGVTIKQATLNNFEFIEKLPLVDEEGNILQENYGVKLYDTILTERSNDVIPKVLGVISRGIPPLDEEGNPENVEIKVPEVCSSCGSPIIKDGAHHFCDNINCPDRLRGSLELFASRDAMDIKDFGTKNIDTFVELGHIKSLLDIYSLSQHKDAIVQLNGYGDKKIDKILESIENSKKQSFERVLSALGILNVGKKTAKDLAKTFKNIDNLIAATQEQLMNVEDIGPETSASIMHFFSNKKNIEMINEFKKIGLCFEIVENDKATTILEGKTFVITGTLKEKRDFYKDLIELNGGKSVGSVSKKTHAVIIGEDAGSKETKARELVDKGEPVRLIEGHDSFVAYMLEFGIEI